MRKIERTIILPLFDNEQVSLQCEVGECLQELLQISGGYSQVLQSGVWLEEETIYSDPHELRIITTNEGYKDARIERLIKKWCTRLRQRAIYTDVREVSCSYVYA